MHLSQRVSIQKDTSAELYTDFFKDGRSFDGPAMKRAMVRLASAMPLCEHAAPGSQHVQVSAYAFVDGMEALLGKLSAAGVEMHAFSNYPAWWRDLEAGMKLSRFLTWSFVSCEGPMAGHRKPSPAAFAAVEQTLRESHAQPLTLTLVDDRLPNVEAARAAGWQAVHFRDCRQLEGSLAELGVYHDDSS